jgi:CHAT domain-containing protein
LAFVILAGWFNGLFAAIPLGDSLSGERCELVVRDDIEQTSLQQEYRLFCDGKLLGNVVAQNQVFLSSSPDRNDTVKVVSQQFARSQAATLIAQRMQCKPGYWPSFQLSDDADKRWIALPCQQKNGGWPHLVLIYSEPQRVVVADGAPSLLPVMLRSLETVVANTNAAQSTRVPSWNNAQWAELLQQIWGQPVRLFTAADYDRYKQLVRDARVANSARKFAVSESLFRQALQLQTQLLGEDAEALADTLMDLALDLSNNGRFDESAALLRRAEKLVQKSSKDADRARYLTYLGYDAANQRNIDQALLYARSATALWRKMIQAGGNPLAALSPGAAEEAARADRGELAMALNLEANMALRSGDWVSAQVAATEALQILNTTAGLPIWWKPDVLVTLGEISIAQGRISAAETYLNTALELRKQQNGHSVATLSIMMTLAAGYQAEGLHTSAIVTYRDALKLAQSLPGGIADALSVEQLVPFAAAVVDLAPTIQDLPSRQALYAEAYDAFQKIRGQVVERTIAAASARMATDNPAVAEMVRDLQNLERKRDTAQSELAYESTLPDNQRSGNLEAELAQRIKQTNEQVQEQYSLLAKRFPDYVNLTSPKPVPLSDLQQRLAPNEGVLSFLIGRKASFVQLVTRTDLVIARMPESADTLVEATQNLRRAFNVESGRVAEFDLARAHSLYQSIFMGIGSQMRGIDHLIVVPSGALSSLPFGILVTQPPATNQYTKADWLARTLAITHSPSLKAFYQSRSTPRSNQAQKPMLAMGDPAVGGLSSDPEQRVLPGTVACRQAEPAPASLLLGMSALPETAQEIARIRMLLGPGSEVFLRHQAQESVLHSVSLQDYRILYFATHGLLPGELRCQTEPALVLTPPAQPATARNQDGLLEASEIAALNLNADLVVLSACNTAGAGGRFGGEAMSGLAEAFFAAGARNLLVSHWQVPSASTAQLMIQLFENWGANLQHSGARALQFAQSKMLEKTETSHPFYWGAFVLVGDGGQGVRP